MSSDENSETSRHSPHEQDAANLAFDLTRQFITLAVGGIGFAVGIHHAAPTAASAVMFWAILSVFGGSAIFGLAFLMHGIGRLYQDKSYDVYATGLRVLSILQILLVAFGGILLCSFLGKSTGVPNDATNGSIQVKVGDDLLTYPHETDKNYTIGIENGKVNFSATNNP